MRTRSTTNAPGKENVKPTRIKRPLSSRSLRSTQAPIAKRSRKLNIVTTKKQSKRSNLLSIRSQLSSAGEPERLPCRKTHFNTIYQFVQSALDDTNTPNRCIYISGVPGTGKTATVHRVMNQLKESRGNEFKWIEVNGMRLTDPSQVFIEIANAIRSEKKMSAAASRRWLNKHFELMDRQRKTTILVVDEMDLLITKRQDVLYDIFNWTQINSSKFIVIALANTLDLPERILKPRVASRMGMTRISFAPYTFAEIEEILNDRLCDYSNKDVKALQLIGRKVAAVTGDIRKALDLIRTAVDLAISKGDTKLTLQHASEVLQERSRSNQIQLIRALPVLSRSILQNCCNLHQSTGREDWSLSEIIARYRSSMSEPPLTVDAACEYCLKMADSRLLVAGNARGILSRRFRLGISVEDFNLATKS